MNAVPAVSVTEVRVLEGPNLYFVRPAVKVSLELPGYLSMPEPDARATAGRLSLRGVRPGPAGSEQRQRFVMRLVAHVVRRLAAGSGTARLAVRTRSGSRLDQVVVAFPWRRRGRALALADGLEAVLSALLSEDAAKVRHTLEATVAAVCAAPDGLPPAAVRPGIPVASVTGTNGKTTTTRLLAHMGMTAGLTTAWSSTDGVVAQGVTVEPGDYSGPAGARTVLATPGVQLGVLETARGGLLLKGMGVTVNDVSVVTNVSEDHLGLQGVETVDQLAEVKAIVTKVTKSEGWVILNGDDPRVWAMRTGIRAKPWAFSLDADSPALRESLAAGGRAMTVLDGDLVAVQPTRDPDHLVAVVDVPVTLAGLSEHNVANALAATAAGLGLGLPRDAVVEALRTFAPDPRHNPGRMNVYSLPLPAGGAATVIVDLAHNEAGLEALLRVGEGLRPPGAGLHLGLGTGGDRTDEILQTLGELAGRRADRVCVVHKEHYLRGRSMTDLENQFRLGLSRVGVAQVASYGSELAGLQGMAAGASDGDVLAIMCHADRPLLDAWLLEHGARVDDAATVRAKVLAARGEHPDEAELGRLVALLDPRARFRGVETLWSGRPGDPRLAYELARARTAVGQDPGAMYDQALASGLREPYRTRAMLERAWALRRAGDAAGAGSLLGELASQATAPAAVAAFRALVLLEEAQPGAAVAELLDAVMARTTDATDEVYRPMLAQIAASLR